MKLLSEKLSIEYSVEKQAILIVTTEKERSRTLPIQIEIETLKKRDFSQAAEFIGNIVLLTFPEMRELFAEFLWEEREPPQKISSADSQVSKPTQMQACIAGITQAGDQISIKLGIGRPYCLSEGRWRCDISLEPLYSCLPAVPGRDAFQASGFAHHQLLDLLHLFVEKGGKLLNADGSILDLNVYTAFTLHVIGGF